VVIGLVFDYEVAIVGTDNDDLLCQMARPSLSSVANPTEKIGYEAAALLERLIGGLPPPDGPILLPPLGVVSRQSSDTLAIDDPDVVAAIRLLRARSHQPTSVVDILRALPVGRRTLERKFQKALGRGVSQEIRRIRMERARQLLVDRNRSIVEVAERAGFSSARHLSVAFRAQMGMSPTAYRDQFQARLRT
jgi:LacI family transcriptional regulator